ncbi:MAG: YitT family protein [Muribaculaceae bacterium]|nr:YitT family protein [Muribaculaceae bacterium]
MSELKLNLWRNAKDYFFITLGVGLYALGFCAFILPEKVVIGGLAGLGTLVYFLTNIPVGITQYALNLLLLAIAYKVVGRQFVIGTIYGATMISVFVSIFQPLFDAPLTNEPFMNIVVGGIMCGFGIGLTFVHNGSSGGTDIVAAMVSKHSNVSIGRMMLYTDFFIISSSYLLFHDLDKVVYGFVVLFLVSYMADLVINTNRQAVQFTIFSPHWKEIATAINNEAKRGCTVLSGMGWYSKQEVKVLLVMCRKIESVTIFRIIKSIDSNAFITQANVNGVYGKGFDEVKVKMKVDDGGKSHKSPFHFGHGDSDNTAQTGHPKSMA